MDFFNPVVLASYIISFTGYVLMTSASALKRKNQILIFQSAANILCMVSEGLVYAWSGLVQDLVNFIRNLFIMKKWMNKVLSIIFIVLGTGIGVAVCIMDFSNAGYWGILPVFATFQYSVIILIPDVKVPLIKSSIGISAICWAVYGVAIKLYTTTIFNLISLILCIISIVLYLRKKKKNAGNDEKDITDEAA